jgi:D-lactate dehydrogenase
VQANAEAIRATCAHDGLIRAEIAPDLKALWAARKALSPLLRDIAPKKINEDVVVPVSRLPELLQGLAELSAKYGIANANFGHAGNGNMHVNLLVNPDDADELQRAEACLDEIFTLVLRLNGTISGEHGVGREKRPFVAREIDPVTLQLMRDIRQVFDPNSILNPGKMFPQPPSIPPCASIRYADCLLDPLQGGSAASSPICPSPDKGRMGGV